MKALLALATLSFGFTSYSSADISCNLERATTKIDSLLKYKFVGHLKEKVYRSAVFIHKNTNNEILRYSAKVARVPIVENEEFGDIGEAVIVVEPDGSCSEVIVYFSTSQKVK